MENSTASLTFSGKTVVLENERTFLIEYLLAEEVAWKGKELSTKKWRFLMKTHVATLEEAIGLENLCMLSSLAAVCCIVGSRSTAKFNKAFCLLLSWEPMGGPYWIIQSELIRHYLIPLMRAKEEEMDMQSIDKWLRIAEDCTCNSHLKAAVVKIHAEFIQLKGLDELNFRPSSNSHSQNVIDYENSHSLEAFVSWCINFLTDILKKALKVQVGNKGKEDATCRSDGVSNLSSSERPKLRRKYHRGCSDESIVNLFSNIAALSYEEDTEESDTPETLNLAAFLSDKLLRLAEDKNSASPKTEEELSQHDYAPGDYQPVPKEQCGAVVNDSKPLCNSQENKSSLTEHSQSLPYTSSSSDEISSSTPPQEARSFFSMVQEAMMRVM